MSKQKLKKIVEKHSIVLSRVYRLLMHNKTIIKGSGNVINRDRAYMSRCIIRIIGDNNTIQLNNLGGGQLL